MASAEDQPALARAGIFGAPADWSQDGQDKLRPLQVRHADHGPRPGKHRFRHQADPGRTRRFHYILSNPPYGVDWKRYREPVREEEATHGKDGRFGTGLSRISDGQLPFLQLMIAKMRADKIGSRITMNGLPLFTGAAGSGESEILR
ncbi:MAG: SAM-dependent methyltransferase [Gemmobacter sp.]|jgi:type I restriction-modification system DNA methylase subunit|nr:SAM-dependent methyltransferase [Gemmobacter sp.]